MWTVDFVDLLSVDCGLAKCGLARRGLWTVWTW